MDPAKMLKKAGCCAPRGKRAIGTPNTQAGAQSISPLMWDIETGSLEAAKATVQDLLTIRADRNCYYYGRDIMFERHPVTIKRLCLDATASIPVLRDGLVWCSRVTQGGQRRVNYYIKHLVVEDDGDFTKALEWFTDYGDPELACHSTMTMVTEMVRGRVALRTFWHNKAWSLFTLLVFISTRPALNHLQKGDGSGSNSGRRLLEFACLLRRL